MKKILFLLSCIFFISCSENQDYENKEKQESQSYQIVKSQELQLELLNYLSKNTSKTRNSPVVTKPAETYEFSTQEIICPQNQSSDEQMIVVRGKNNRNNAIAFFKRDNTIENCLVVEQQPNTTSTEGNTFVCRDDNNAFLFKAMINNENTTCNVIEIDENNIAQMQLSGRSWGCNLALGTAGVIWSTAAGMIAPGIGALVGFAWCAFQTWACNSTSSATEETAIYPNDSTATTIPISIIPDTIILK